jgi:hypothetical protein
MIEKSNPKRFISFMEMPITIATKRGEFTLSSFIDSELFTFVKLDPAFSC